MYGFTINKGFESNRTANRVISYKDNYCVNNMIHRFEDDKLFFEDSDCIVILDGVILNKKDIIKKNDWAYTVKNLYYKEGDLFFRLFRGCFAGAIYDKQLDRWVIYSDHIGQKYVYYYFDGNRLSCSLMMDEIYSTLKDNNVSYSLDDKAAYMLLSYGFMLENYTLCEKIRKLLPGNYLVISNGVLEEQQYYYLKNELNYTRSERETIEEVDRLFRRAVMKQFEKDQEYGYNHICALSGGLDARMVTFVAHDLGYKKQLNFTFSQSDYYDDFLPKHMARDLKHEWLFKALDNGLWLYDVDRITKVTGGNVLYYGLAHGDSLFRLLNLTEFGLIHSGQLGDVVLSTKIRNNDEKYVIGDGAYSNKYLHLLQSIHLPNYPNKEIGFFYTRCLNGANNGLQNIFNYSETCSPFVDLDFLEYCFSIPNNYRYNHGLYKKWILQKYPKAAEYAWETTHSKISTPVINIGGKSATITDIPRMLFRKLSNVIGISDNKTGMNPLGKYLKENDELRETLFGLFSYLDCISNKELLNTIVGIKNSGTSMEKIQAISLLSALKMYYS